MTGLYQTEKVTSGSYRIRGQKVYAVIQKSGDWRVEIRSQESGQIIRYAGRWATLSEAKDEALFVMNQMGEEIQ